MADEFNSGTTNWWDSARSSSSSSSGLNMNNNNSSSLVGSFGWQTEIVDMKTRSSIDSSASNSVSAGSSSVVFQDHNLGKLQQQQQGHDSGHDFHMMGLGLSSPSLDWNQALLRGDKTESSFRSMLQDNLNSSNNTNYHHHHQQQNQHQHDHQWRPDNPHHSSLNRGFTLDPHHNYGLSSSDSTVTCQGLPSTTFHHQIDSSTASLYSGNPSNILQGLLLGTSDSNNNNNNNNGSNQYAMNTGNHDLLSSSSSSWSKVPQFLRSTTSPPKQQLHFSNNAPFWNASAAAAAAISNDVRSNSGFFPSLHTPPYSTPTFDEKPKHNIPEVRESSTVTKKSEPTSKRARNETSSNLPAFKVRKEKMGDRITALQQLVSPFGKTDTASVLSEAIEYIKFLHEQVTVLSTPYMKSGAPIQHHQSSDKSKDGEGPKQDLRSRGLCLVPISSTFPVTHETTVDFWTPTFGGTFR